MSAQTQAQPQSQALNHQTMSQRELRAFQEWGPSTIHARSSSPPKNPVQNQNQGQGQGQNQNQGQGQGQNQNQSRGQIPNGNSNNNANANSNAPKQASQTTHRRRNGRNNRARASSIFDEWKAQATQEDSKRKSNGATGDNNIDHKNNNGDGSSKNEVLNKKETSTGGLSAVSSCTGPASSTVGRSEGQGQGQAVASKPAAGQPGFEGSRRGRGRRNSQAQRSSGAASTDGPKKVVNGKNSGVAASTGAVGSSGLSSSSTAADSRPQFGKDVKDTLAHQQSSGAASIDNGLKKVSGQENNAVDSAGLPAGSSGLPASSTASQHSVASGSAGAKTISQPGRGRKDSRARQQSSASADNETKKAASNGDSGDTGFPGSAPVSSTASRPDNQPAAVTGPRSQSGRNRRDSHIRQKHDPSSSTNGPKKAQEKDATISAGAPLNSTTGSSEPHPSAGQSAAFPGSEKANGRSQSEKNGKDTRQGVSKSISARDESKKSVNSKVSGTNASTSSSARSSYSAPVTSTVGRSGGLPVPEEAKGRSQSKMNDKNARQGASESVSTNGELKNAVSSKESSTVTSASSSATSTVGRSEGQPVVAGSKKPENRTQTGSDKKDSHSRQEFGSKKVVSKESVAGSPDGSSNTLPVGPIAATTGPRPQSGTDEKGVRVHQKPEYVSIEKKVVSSKNRSAAAISTRLSANAPSFVPGSSTFGHPHGHQPGAAPGSRERDSRSQLRSKDAGQGTSASISTENASKEAVSTKESGVAIAGSLNSTTDCPRVQPTVSSVGSDSAENCSQPEDDWKDCRTCQDSGSVPTDDAPKKVASSKESGTAASVSSSAGFSNLSSVRSSTCQSEGQVATVAGSEGQKNCPQSGKDKENAHQGSSEKGGSYNSKLTGYNIGYDKLTWPFPDQAQKNKACPLPPKPNIESINRRVSTSPDKKSERRVQYSAQDVRSLDYQAPSGAFLNSNQLARLSEGVKMPPKHTVYFLPSFVEDPWKGLKSVEIGCLSRFW